MGCRSLTIPSVADMFRAWVPAVACRVGMAVDPVGRIAEWRKRYTITRWWVLRSGLSYDDALAYEKSYAQQYGCVHHGGGQRVPGLVWSVYIFHHY